MGETISVAKKLTLGLLKTLLLSISITWAAMFLYNPVPNPFGIAIITGILLMLGILSFTIYLNLIPAFRRSIWLSALSFFALPIGFPVLYTIYYEEFRGELGILIFTLPFTITHIYYFIRFRGINLLFNIKLNTNIKITVARLYFTFIASVLIIMAICCIPNRPWKLPYYQGYVTDLEGNPITGALVRENLEIYHETITDSTGYFRLKRNKDVLCPLVVSKEGYLTDTCETSGHHFEMGPVYHHLQYPDRVILCKDTTPVISNGVRMHWKHIEGYWVLSDYFDNIMKYKSIAKFRTTPLADKAWALRIANDSIYTAGLVHGINLACYKESHIAAGIGIEDTITFNLFYNTRSDIITAQRKEQPNEIYTYRKATGKLKDILTNTPFNFELWKVMTQYYMEELIAGTYENVADESNTLILSPDRTLSGFGKYNRFNLHSFFGTSYPFDNHDTISFTDTKTGESVYFTWRFNNYKLILTEIQILPETEDESYYITTRKFGFIRK